MYPWNKFFHEKIEKIFTEKKSIIDIGGGLRVKKDKGSRFDESRKWILPFLEKVDYKILDPVLDYKPDIIGDIHSLPFEDNSEEAIICIAVLEHVENPHQAAKEMHRVLKPGGYCFVYVPFLFYYHADKGYYKDYWRFTKDSLEILFKNFKVKEIQGVRGAMATWIKLSPFGRYKIFLKLAHLIDKVTGKIKTNQVSGYYIFLEK